VCGIDVHDHERLGSQLVVVRGCHQVGGPVSRDAHLARRVQLHGEP
jgi:hypothetical protein